MEREIIGKKKSKEYSEVFWGRLRCDGWLVVGVWEEDVSEFDDCLMTAWENIVCVPTDLVCGLASDAATFEASGIYSFLWIF